MEDSFDRRDFLNGAYIVAAFGLVAGSPLPKEGAHPIQSGTRDDVRHAIKAMPKKAEKDE